MGTWAIHSFGNDDASDLIGNLTEQSGLAPLREAIGRVLAAAGYLEAPDAQQAVAACEVLAIARGKPSAAARPTEDLAAWITRTKPIPDSMLTSQAVQALDRILAEDSELAELWEESDDYSSWQTEIAGLRTRLQA